MLLPKKTKFRKRFRGSIKGRAWRGGKLWIRIFPDKPVSRKPAEIRMGGGKSAVDHYPAEVKIGRIILEISGVPTLLSLEALKLAAAKLPLATKIVKK